MPGPGAVVVTKTAPAAPMQQDGSPAVGPDYEPDRDCGNCGFERPEDGEACDYCGGYNTGPRFDPRLMTRNL
jgi:hypothetical protein